MDQQHVYIYNLKLEFLDMLDIAAVKLKFYKNSRFYDVISLLNKDNQDIYQDEIFLACDSTKETQPPARRACGTNIGNKHLQERKCMIGGMNPFCCFLRMFGSTYKIMPTQSVTDDRNQEPDISGQTGEERRLAWEPYKYVPPPHLDGSSPSITDDQAVMMHIAEMLVDSILQDAINSIEFGYTQMPIIKKMRHAINYYLTKVAEMQPANIFSSLGNIARPSYLLKSKAFKTFAERQYHEGYDDALYFLERLMYKYCYVRESVVYLRLYVTDVSPITHTLFKLYNMISELRYQRNHITMSWYELNEIKRFLEQRVSVNQQALDILRQTIEEEKKQATTKHPATFRENEKTHLENNITKHNNRLSLLNSRIEIRTITTNFLINVLSEDSYTKKASDDEPTTIRLLIIELYDLFKIGNGFTDTVVESVRKQIQDHVGIYMSDKTTFDYNLQAPYLLMERAYFLSRIFAKLIWFNNTSLAVTMTYTDTTNNNKTIFEIGYRDEEDQYIIDANPFRRDLLKRLGYIMTYTKNTNNVITQLSTYTFLPGSRFNESFFKVADDLSIAKQTYNDPSYIRGVDIKFCGVAGDNSLDVYTDEKMPLPIELYSRLGFTIVKRRVGEFFKLHNIAENIFAAMFSDDKPSMDKSLNHLASLDKEVLKLALELKTTSQPPHLGGSTKKQRRIISKKLKSKT